MALVVRNTFLQYSQQGDAEEHGRSNSAPPTSRHANRDKGDYESAAVSTTCESLDKDTSTVVSDNDDAVSTASYMTEYEGVSPSVSRQEIDTDDEASLQPMAVTDHHQPVPTDAQQQLEQMSQMVMEIWSKLRSMESSMEAQLGDTAPTGTAAESKSLTAQISAPPATKSFGQPAACQKLVANARPFVPSCESKSNEVQKVLSLVGQALTLARGVTDVGVNVGPAGTLATITARVDSNILKSSVITAAKSAFLEVAATSQSTYVLGYEATPFQDDAAGSGFCAALATMPAALECSACWDTYTMGTCPRKRTCKWQHPGRSELQPVRVVVH